MQSLPLKVLAGQTVTVPCPGSGIWFESGTSTTGDNYIVVKPDTGAEIRLKPGQHFQDQSEMTGTWRITASDAAAVIAGYLVIGNGDFGDSNVNGTFTMSSTVQVGNLPASPVPIQAGTGVTLPVSIAGTQAVALPGTTMAAPLPIQAGTGITLPVSIAGVVNVSSGTMAYTSSYTSGAALAANTPVTIVAPGTNVNGVVINRTLLQNSNTNYVFVAKTSAPATVFDGDLLAFQSASATSIAIEDTQIKVPAGRGIYLIATAASAGEMKSMLYTVL